MILERLVLVNFRQFRGRHEILLSDNKTRNVTLVHAENGFGKTTILNAFRWALHGADGLTVDFRKPNEIINEIEARVSRDPREIAAIVELTFKHDLERITVTRKLTLAQQRDDSRKAQLTVEVLRDGQTLKDIEGPLRKIHMIVPEGIAKFLFFNGENIDHLAMEENSAKVSEAIRVMLGLELLKTTISDLKHPNVRGKFVKELRDSTSMEKQVLLDEQQDCDTEVVKLVERREQVVKEIESCDREVQSIDRNLETKREAAELQRKRIRLQNDVRDLRAKLSETSGRISRLIAEDGYTLFAKNLVIRGREIVSILRAEGKIPARVLNTFLHELLESGNCICKRCLEIGTPERAAVENLLTIAGDQEFNNAVGALDNALGVIDSVSTITRENLKSLNSDRLEMSAQIRRIDEELEDIHQEIGSKNDNQVQELEDARTKYLVHRDALQKDIGRMEIKELDIKKRLVEIGKSINAIIESEEASILTQRRLDAVNTCISTVEAILEAETNIILPFLNAEIKNHFGILNDRGYWAELSSDYTLHAKNRLTSLSAGVDEVIEVASNTGLRQCLSLAFIGSLVSLAEKRSEMKCILQGIHGAVYPIVMDSPFGQLDDANRRGVAEMLPKLANQVVALVTSSQYNGSVAEVFSKQSLIGKRYCLIYHGPNVPPDAKKQIEIEGKIIQIYQQSEDEYTVIKEI